MDQSTKRADFSQFKAKSRKAVRLSQEDLIKLDYLDTGKQFPLVIRPHASGLHLVRWAENKREFIESRLLERGGILFRGFNLDGVSQFEQFARAICGELLDYRERAAPRREIGSRVYTSTEFPPDQQHSSAP